MFIHVNMYTFLSCVCVNVYVFLCVYVPVYLSLCVLAYVRILVEGGISHSSWHLSVHPTLLVCTRTCSSGTQWSKPYRYTVAVHITVDPLNRYLKRNTRVSIGRDTGEVYPLVYQEGICVYMWNGSHNTFVYMYSLRPCVSMFMSLLLRC